MRIARAEGPAAVLLPARLWTMHLDTLLRMAAFTAAAWCLGTRPLGAQSGSDVDQSHQFGTVKQGEKVVHAFTLRNDGAAPLTIERVDLSGPRMSARFARLIPPGQEGKIMIEWDTGQLAGEVEAEGIVRFTEMARPPLTLFLKGSVTPAIEFIPYPAVFLSVFAGERAEGRIRIVNHEERPLAIKGLEGGRRFPAALDTIEPGKTYELRVEVPTGAPPGRHEEALYLDTDHPTHRRIPIALNVLVKTEVYANPEEVDFGVVSLAELSKTPSLLELLTQTVLIKKRKGEFAIEALTSDLPFLQIARSPDGRSNTFRIDVGLDPQRLRAGPLKGSIHVITSDQAFRELFIAVGGELQ